MSGDDKRFDATPSRRARAIREGNSPRSSELSSIAAFAAALLAAGVALPLGAAVAARAIADAAAGRAFPAALTPLAFAALAPVAAAATAGAAVSLLQSGGLHPRTVKIDAKKLDPVAGLKRMVGTDALVGAVRAMLAFAAAIAALIPLARDVVPAAAVAPPPALAGLVAGAAARACAASLAVGAVFALADYALVRRRWLRGLRMSLEEMKREVKENDGDPQARARRKNAHRALVRGSIERTRDASFVVVNPTHVAVALRYAPPAVPVPEILVRALDEGALRVREIAREHAIPIVEDVALARLLYAQGENGSAIPPETYVAVAHVIAGLARQGLLT